MIATLEFLRDHFDLLFRGILFVALPVLALGLGATVAIVRSVT